MKGWLMCVSDVDSLEQMCGVEDVDEFVVGVLDEMLLSRSPVDLPVRWASCVAVTMVSVLADAMTGLFRFGGRSATAVMVASPAMFSGRTSRLEA